MQNEQTIPVGKVTKAHGVRGELFVHLFAGKADWLDELDALILRRPKTGREPSQAQVYEIKSVRPHKTGLIFKTVEVNDRDMAESLRGSLMEIPRQMLVSDPGESIYLVEILNFQLRDTNAKEPAGEIVGFSTNGAQDLLVVKTGKGTYQVPWVEPLIVNIDFENKLVEMDLPEGLFEL